MRVLVLSLILLLAAGCRQPAQSQQEAFPPTRSTQTAMQLDSATVALQQSRRTAITRAVETATPAVVSVNVIEVQRVRARDPFADPFFEQFFGRRSGRIYEREVQNVGSGFVISPDGYVVTNDHVAGEATKITVSFSDGTTRPAELVGTDPISDIALLQVQTEEELPFLAFSGMDPIPGEWAIALGNPFGLFEAADPSVTVGVVSATGRNLEPQEGRVYRDMIQTDASINRGNSGGPLLNATGEVIGVNAAIYSQSGGSVGIGFAVPSSKVRRILAELRETGTVDRSFYTGLYLSRVTPRIARALGMEEAQGVIVRDLDEESPAEAAGFEPYDVIVAANGESVDSQQDLIAILYDFRPGDTLRFTVLRQDAEEDLDLRLGEAQ